MSDQVKGFIISNEAWYCQHPKTRLPEEELLVANFSDGGNTCEVGEVMITWNDKVPCLDYDKDTRLALREISEAVPLIKDIIDREITIQEVAEALVDIGYVDLTERVRNIKL